MYIYHCCMTPELLALFKLGVLQKVWFRPQVGNFLLFNAARGLGWFAVGVPFTNLSSLFMTVLGTTRESSRTFFSFSFFLFFYPENLCVIWLPRWEKRASRCLETRRSHEEERDHDTRSPLLSPNRKLEKSRRQRWSLTTRSWVVTACPTLRKNANNAFLHSPDGFLLQSQRSAPRRAADCPGWREGGCWVNSDQCFTRRVLL